MILYIRTIASNLITFKKFQKSLAQTRTWLTSCWGWSRGSVSDRALELELLGSWLFLDPEFGYRSEADRSNGREPLCCCKMMVAAARACSWIKASSNFSLREDRSRVQRLLELEETAGGFPSRFVVFFSFTGFGARQAQRLPIGGACRAAQRRSHTQAQRVRVRERVFSCEKIVAKSGVKGTEWGW